EAVQYPAVFFGHHQYSSLRTCSSCAFVTVIVSPPLFQIALPDPQYRSFPASVPSPVWSVSVSPASMTVPDEIVYSRELPSLTVHPETSSDVDPVFSSTRYSSLRFSLSSPSASAWMVVTSNGPLSFTPDSVPPSLAILVVAGVSEDSEVGVDVDERTGVGVFAAGVDVPSGGFCDNPLPTVMLSRWLTGPSVPGSTGSPSRSDVGSVGAFSWVAISIVWPSLVTTMLPWVAVQ